MERKMKTIELQWKLQSEIGPLYLVATQNGLRGLFWKKQSAPMAASPKESNILLETIKQVEEYLCGERRKFSIPLDLQGTEFQKRVWQELLRIPYGKTRSYKEIAELIQNEKAVRAVGTANGRNPISLIVPCHRVIGSNGTLTGYAGGLNIKEKLLKLEGVI
jgi:methylated-DNA-[protein]-cysteine S-methyltransferase